MRMFIVMCFTTFAYAESDILQAVTTQDLIEYIQIIDERIAVLADLQQTTALQTAELMQLEQIKKEIRAFGQVDGMNLVSCGTCATSAHFSAKARTLFFRLPPQINTGTKRAFIFNARVNRIQVFDITRFNPNTLGTIRFPPNPILPPQIRVDRINNPDPAKLQKLRDALEFLVEFKDENIGDIDFGDLGLPQLSAIDFVGPENSQAGFNRGELNATLRDLFNTDLRRDLGSLAQGIRAIVNTVVELDPTALTTVITVHFPDGSKIDVEIERTASDSQGRPVLDSKSKANTARADGIPFVPQSSGQLGGFNRTTQSRDTALSLIGLAGRYGFNTTTSSSSSGEGCRFECDSDGNCTLYLNC